MKPRLAVCGALAILFTLRMAVASAGPGPLRSGRAPADWLPKWQANISAESRSRYCDREMGEELGWLVSPFINGFYYGYLATGDTKWIDLLVDWTDSWVKRAVAEPDGYPGWPKDDGASTQVVPGLFTDNMLGEAMALRPAVLMGGAILKSPALRARYGDKARAYVTLAERVFEKWDRRGCWRAVKDGGVWVVPEYGIDKQTGKWTEGYARRASNGFTLPANKQNHIARWLIALYDVTGKRVYRDRAERWWRTMRSRMRLSPDGKRVVWNYWDPAGAWDYKADGSTRHWVGVHPNGGYYGIDVESIVCAYEHHLVFTRADIDRLIATNRDGMWNQQVPGARFARIDAGPADDRWKGSPGVLWAALVPYDRTLQSVFEANHDPAGWGGLSATPWYLARMSGKLRPGQ